jgi:DNA-binding FrmR family transcriptional regulator
MRSEQETNWKSDNKEKSVVKRKELECCHDSNKHPSHTAMLPRLKKLKGQIAGIERMIEERRYCVDILVQFRAAMAALRTVEVSVFETHLRHCVQEALKSQNEKMIEEKIQELTELLSKRSII